MAVIGRNERGPASGGASSQSVVHAEDNLWVLSRFEDCRTVLRDPRFGSDARKASDYAEEVERSNRGPALAMAASALMVYTDPPDHTRLRGLVKKAFTPRRLESFRPRIQTIVDELLAAGERDVVGDLAYP